jgi:SAM-dependent methyltransferase
MAEIGCGLGHIIRNIRCRNKTGYDTDENVLRAAEFLSKFWKRGKIKFKKFTFPQDDLKMKYDLIIMVNWIHEINSSLLKQHIIKYYYNNLNHGGIIILDTVQDKNYMYNHQIDFLIENLSCSLHEIGNDIAQRKIYSIVKTP